MDSLELAVDGNFDSLRVIHQNRMYFDSTTNLLTELETHIDQFNSILDEYDSLAQQGVLKIDQYRNIATFILEYEIPTGYDFLLKYALLFKAQSPYNAADASKGVVSILPRVVLHKVSDMKKAESFKNYILYSGYINKQLNMEELNMISAILGINSGETFYILNSDQSLLIQNKKKILEILYPD